MQEKEREKMMAFSSSSSRSPPHNLINLDAWRGRGREGGRAITVVLNRAELRTYKLELPAILFFIQAGGFCSLPFPNKNVPKVAGATETKKNFVQRKKILRTNPLTPLF